MLACSRPTLLASAIRISPCYNNRYVPSSGIFFSFSLSLPIFPFATSLFLFNLVILLADPSNYGPRHAISTRSLLLSLPLSLLPLLCHCPFHHLLLRPSSQLS